MKNLEIKTNIINDFKNGLTTNELIDKYGYSKSTINEWLRPVRLKIEEDTLKKAVQNDVVVLSTEMSAYDTIGKMYELGIRNRQ